MVPLRGVDPHVAGLELLEPAYRRFRVEPRPGGGLEWADAVLDAPYGRIESAWRIDGSRLTLTVTVPAGTTAEVVLPDGRVIRTSRRPRKSAAGYDLTRLFVGSEGLLGVVTEAILKLIPLPRYRALLAAGFDSMRGAAKAIRAIFAAGEKLLAMLAAKDRLRRPRRRDHDVGPIALLIKIIESNRLAIKFVR